MGILVFCVHSFSRITLSAIVTGLFGHRAEASRKRFAVQLKLDSSELYGAT